ncbi:hypothetical protein JM79_2770 [Gramella sp. Hel_I_59]|uniref:hypothetical protein n=1 Tax=Gramella sp. Hel_I_59 TaxID=1249978 RepID=UPI0011515B05|nr:hypothetical protein [Gramella sp. Hel_I_59]TQI71821.1 hypothetical protein JM79_2770 [Gramella sp. Hel_I_59]
MSEIRKNVRKIAIVGTGNPSAQLELAKKRLEEIGMGHIELEILTPEDFKCSYEPPKPIMVIDEYPMGLCPIGPISGSKYHK